MSKRAGEQGWVLGNLIGFGGLEVLHPESRGLDIALGYDHGDLELLHERVKHGIQLRKAWVDVANIVERRAQYYRDAGFSRTAHDLYRRAALLWSHAQYTFFEDDERKRRFYDCSRHCVDQMVAGSRNPIERLRVDTANGPIFAHLHLPAEVDRPTPVVILLPGMDMTKEDYLKVAQEFYADRGMVAVAVDGPGQGETRLNGHVVDVNNYEAGISALLDIVLAREEVDQDRVGVWGMSMGSYWALRCAATDPRIKAAATGLGCYGNIDIVFETGHPSFKTNFMYMAGYDDEEAFDTEIATNMHLRELSDRIACPVFLGFGEFDEISRIEDTLSLYRSLTCPKELCVFGQEFHPLGGVAPELIAYGAEWCAKILDAGKPRQTDLERYMDRWLPPIEGSAEPSWWKRDGRLDQLEEVGR